MNNYLTRRFLAFCIDCVLISIFALFAFFVYATFIFDDRQGYDILRIIPYIFYYCIGMLKDVFGRSIGKKLLKLQIISEYPNEKYMFFRRVARNITFLIWPLEAVIIILRERRLSDKILRLNVVYNDDFSSDNKVNTTKADLTPRY